MQEQHFRERGAVMDYTAEIQAVIDEIETRLYEDIDTAGLAAHAGYSRFHFQRIFAQTVGMTPAVYIRRRRLSEIVRRMEYDTRPISAIAFDCGFNSKENFTRAFFGEHHILPQEYKKMQNSLRLYDRVVLDASFPSLTPEIVTLPSLSLTVYPSDEDFPPHFWNRYNCENRSARLSGSTPVEDIGVCRRDAQTGHLDYWIGIRTEDAHGDTSGTVTLDIPGGLYAVFETPTTTHFSFVDVIQKTWDFIFSTWLGDSGYRFTGGYQLEAYTEKSRIFKETIYIPIEPRETRLSK